MVNKSKELVLGSVANPFNPTLGVEPPLLIERQPLVDAVVDGIASGRGNPYRVALIQGARGVGKTVLMSEIGDALAQRHGFLVINVDTLPSMLEDIIDQLIVKTQHLVAQEKIRITGVNIMNFGLSVAVETNRIIGWRTRFEEFVRLLNDVGVHILISVDEVHHANGELRIFCHALQQILRAKGDIAALFAGLPEAISDILGDRTLTFLRRAKPINLSYLSESSIASSYISVLGGDCGFSIDSDVAKLAAHCTYGHPYFVQLLGYNIFETMKSAAGKKIDSNTVTEARRLSLQDFDQQVIHTSYKDLSKLDMLVLEHIYEAGGSVAPAELTRSTGKSKQQINEYLNRLMSAGLVARERVGVYAFATPYVRDYLERLYGER